MKELVDEMSDKGVSLNDLRGDADKMRSIAEKIGKEVAEDRDKHEIFAGAFSLVDFYGGEGQICFEMNPSFNPRKDLISSLEDLNKFRSGSVSDVAILSKKELRLFQLKRYRESLNTAALLSFIKRKIQKYGNDLGDMNLLVVLQSPENDLSPIDFCEIHEELKKLNFSFGGWVLISYNEKNQFSVVNTVYPGLVTTRVPWIPASLKT